MSKLIKELPNAELADGKIDENFLKEMQWFTIKFMVLKLITPLLEE
jgi:hypothetical protein